MNAFKRAWHLYVSGKRAAMVTLLAGVLATVLLVNSMSSVPLFVISILAAVIIIDVARTYALTRYVGTKKKIWTIANRLCLDSGFWAIASLIFVVIPVVTHISVALADVGTFLALQVLEIYFLLLWIYLSLALFYAGYKIARGENPISASILSSQEFHRAKWKTLKKALTVMVPYVVYFALINIIPYLSGLPATVAAYFAMFFLFGFALPFGEALYVAVNRER